MPSQISCLQVHRGVADGVRYQDRRTGRRRYDRVLLFLALPGFGTSEEAGFPAASLAIYILLPGFGADDQQKWHETSNVT